MAMAAAQAELTDDNEKRKEQTATNHENVLLSGVWVAEAGPPSVPAVCGGCPSEVAFSRRP
jgi:hypothetical protein